MRWVSDLTDATDGCGLGGVEGEGGYTAGYLLYYLYKCIIIAPSGCPTHTITLTHTHHPHNPTKHPPHALHSPPACSSPPPL